MSEAPVATNEEFEAFLGGFGVDPRDQGTEPEEVETSEQEEPEDASGEEVTEDALQQQEERQEAVPDDGNQEEQEDEEVTIDDLAALFKKFSEGDQYADQPTEEPKTEQTQEQPQAQAQPQQQPGWVPEVTGPRLDGDRFDEVMADPEEFNKFLEERDKAVAAGVMNQLMNTMPHMVANISSLVMDSKNVVDGFLEKYPTLEGMQSQVYNAVGRIMNENPGMSRRAATEKLEQELNAAIKIAQKTGKRVDGREKRGRGAARSNPRTSSPKPEEPQELDPTTEAFRNIAATFQQRG
jgi:hypothetical protein